MKKLKEKFDKKQFKLWEQMLLYSSGPYTESKEERIKRTMKKFKLVKIGK